MSVCADCDEDEEPCCKKSKCSQDIGHRDETATELPRCTSDSDINLTCKHRSRKPDFLNHS